MPEFRDAHHAGSPFLSVIPARTSPYNFASDLADGLRRGDAVRVEQAFSPVQIAALQAEAERAHAAGRFAAARMGRARDADPAVRGDEICWIAAAVQPPESNAAPASAALLVELDALRVALDQSLLLGVRSVEAQYARYAPGRHYARHLDRFAASADGGRVLSLVIYLNAVWGVADGGALRLYDGDDRPHDVLPRGGDLVAFLSDRVAHEVLPATKPRWSIAVWLCRDA